MVTVTRRIVRASCVAALALAVARGAQAQAAPDSATIARGRRVYEGKDGGALCVSCHGPQARGVPGLGPDLTDAAWLHGDGSVAFLRSIVKTGVTKPKAGVLTMPPMGGVSLSDEQVTAVAAYIASFRAQP